MKISNRNYPILDKLFKNSLGDLPVFTDDYFFVDNYRKYFNEYWKQNTHYFLQEINVISNSFFEASKKAEIKLLDLFGDMVINDLCDIDINGTFVVDNVVYMIHYQAKKGSEDFELIFYAFAKDGMPICFLIESDILKIYGCYWVSSYFNLAKEDTEEIKKFVSIRVCRAIIYKLFKSYAEVEIKILLPHKKIKDIDCKYINDTNLKLTYLDSKWFTTLIKSDEFKVRGHFRLQPFGQLRQGRKLIWISDFMKTGYTAPARILKLNNP